MVGSRRILLATFGSLGDLHPCLAVAGELQARGHRPVVATHASHGPRVQAEGIAFHAVRPDPAEHADASALMKRIWHPLHGPIWLIRDLIMPNLHASFEDLYGAAADVDLIVSHPATFAAPLVAERRALPWVSTVLAPAGFTSSIDPPALPFAPGALQMLRRMPVVGVAAVRGVFALLRRLSRHWAQPVHELRRTLGLPAAELDPLVEGQYSPHLTLALFSRWLARAQPDWPARVQITGFPFFDRPAQVDGLGGRFDEDARRALQAFLAGGSSPLVFTLGSAAVLNAGDFYLQSVAAARRLGQRAVLLIGPDARNRLPGSLPADIAVFEYVPHSAVFPHAAAIVHQGGIGTTAQAMRAGRPMLVVPFGFDQQDNAARLTRLGIARTLPRRHYQLRAAAQELETLLTESSISVRAADIATKVGAEDGARAAADAILQLLR